MISWLVADGSVVFMGICVCVCVRFTRVGSIPSSAGIGRTGVFIGADIGIQELEATGEVDILRIVSTMRGDRGGMVQTKDQYVFLHKVRDVPW